MADRTPNVGLLTLTLKHIEMHPGQWTQRSWRLERPECGTAYCYAGWATILSGGHFAVDNGKVLSALVVPPGADPANEDAWRPVDVYAAEILGIPAGRIEYVPCGCGFGDCDGVKVERLPELFEADNTLEDLRRIVAELCEVGRG